MLKKTQLYCAPQNQVWYWQLHIENVLHYWKHWIPISNSTHSISTTTTWLRATDSTTHFMSTLLHFKTTSTRKHIGTSHPNMLTSGCWSKYLGHGWVITSHSILWDVITYPCPRYLLLALKSSDVNWFMISFGNVAKTGKWYQTGQKLQLCTRLALLMQWPINKDFNYKEKYSGHNCKECVLIVQMNLLSPMVSIWSFWNMLKNVP